MILCLTICEFIKLIDLMREDKINQIKSVYSYLNATNYAKEHCRRTGRKKIWQ